MKIPNIIKDLADSLSKLPGIGPRQAIRIAYYLAGRGRGAVLGIVKNLAAFTRLSTCPQCFYPHDGATDLCSICSDRERDSGIIAVVEKETDVASLETSGAFNGRYFILGEIRKNGVLGNEERLRLSSLKNNITDNLGGKADEILIGFDHTAYGDMGGEIVIKELSPYAKKITRLGRGIPTGGEVEFADPETLSEAIKRRG